MRKLTYGMFVCVLLLTLAAVLTPVAAQSDAACDLTTEEDFIARGDQKTDAEDYTGAVADYTCALAINPRNTQALFGRAYAYDLNGDFTEAKADYDALLEITPNDGASFNNRGNIYYLRGDYERALADYNRAIEMNNAAETYIPYYNRGNLYAEMGETDLALRDLTQALEINPDYADAYLARASVYLTAEPDKAHGDYLRWIEMKQQQQIDEDAAQARTGLTLSLSEGAVYRIEFEAQAGQEIRAAARTGKDAKVDPLLVLLDVDESPVASDDDSGVNLDAVLRYTVAQTGRYTLLLSHAGGGSDGQVELTLTLDGEAAESSADTYQVYRLAVNDQAVVFTTAGDRLNLRSGPGLDFDILEKLERDSTVSLLEGPRKAEGYAWWRVRSGAGIEGWVVERVETEQTLQPALRVGDPAVVTTGDDTLRVRAGAGRNFDIVAQLTNNTVVFLLEGPQIVDDLSWWKVRTADGIEGWAVERVGEERTLARSFAAG